MLLPPTPARGLPFHRTDLKFAKAKVLSLLPGRTMSLAFLEKIQPKAGRWVVIALFLAPPVLLLHAQTRQEPNLTGLTPNEGQSIESACSYDKLMVGPAAYNRRLTKQLSQLSDSPRPDLTELVSQERQTTAVAQQASVPDSARKKLAYFHRNLDLSW